MIKVKSNLNKQEVYQTAVLGSIWAFVEITAGTLLHLSRVPFRGLMLSVIASILLVTAKNIINYKGSLVSLGLICASLKTMISGVFILNPIIAIIIESIIAELVFIFFKNGFFGSVLAGISVLFYTFLHSILAQIFFFGFEIFKVYESLISNIFPIKTQNISLIYFVFFAYAFIHLILGGLSGFIGFRLGTKTLALINSKNEIY